MHQQAPQRAPTAPTRAPGSDSRWSWPGIDDGRWRLTAACGLATMLAALALSPLLDGGWWLIPTAIVVAAVCGAGGSARSLRAPAPTQPLISAATLLVMLTLLFARGEAVLGLIPGPAAIGRLQHLALQGREFIEASVPPAGEDMGLLLLIAGGVGLTALVVDTLACALDLPGATLLPLGCLFLVPWVIGHGSAPAWTFLVVSLAWVAILAAAQGDWARRWAPSARAGRVAVGMGVSMALALGALVAGSIAANRQPILTLGSGLDIGQGGGTVQVDELVSLRRSLVQNDDREVLTYTTDAAQPDYLRLAVLDWFNGEQWSRPTAGTLAATPPTWASGVGPSADWARYDVRVGPLGGATVPSPHGTVDAQTNWPVLWDQRSTLPTRSDGRGIKGQEIGLTVWPMPWDAGSLRLASTQDAIPFGVFQSDRADPTDLIGPQLGNIASEVTRDATTPYDQAMALQNWFTLTGGFRYSTEVEGGSGGNALDAFLTERVGYCEQFAATMALMARTLGIPARVVVGFTSGRLEGDRWVVRGTDAHAWPELWMGTAGWVRFEPTPGAPTVRAPSYTRQVNSGLPAGVPTAAASPGAGGDTQDPQGRLPDSSNDAAAAAAGQSRMAWQLAVGLVGTILLILLPLVVRVVRRRRRLAGTAEQVYREVIDSARDYGVLADELGTPRASLTALGTALGVSEGMLTAAVRAAAGGPQADLKAAIAAQRPRTLPGLESVSEAEEHQTDLAVALARICGAVEHRRYALLDGDEGVDASLVGAGTRQGASGAAGDGPATPDPGRDPAASAASVPGSAPTRTVDGPARPELADGARLIRSTLAARAPRLRRILAPLAPLSLIPARGDRRQ
jgi:transglutaminase-like putative cysteine protease